MNKLFIAIMQRDFRLNFRNQTEILYPLLFFVILIGIFPLAITADEKILQIIAPGLINILFVLAIILNCDRLFQEDFRDGCLTLFYLSNHSLSLIALTRITVNWLTSCVPLLLLTPVMALLFHFSAHAIVIQLAVLLLISPVLCLLGAFANALTLGLRQSGMLLLLLVLPLYIPLIIFGAGTVSLSLQNLNVDGQLALLSAILIVSVMTMPILISSILKLRLSE